MGTYTVICWPETVGEDAQPEATRVVLVWVGVDDEAVAEAVPPEDAG
jgi:hypothetical protein